MRKPLLAGNWKMNTNAAESVKLATELKNLVAEVNDRDILVCPPFTAISQVSDTLRDSVVMVGGQNLHWEEKGAFTGEISATMLKSVGATYVIIGHSERRQYFGETDETVNKKVKSAIKHNLKAIVCVGETLEQREKGEALKVIEKQTREGLAGLEVESCQSLVIAYEPVWAIGTGKTATPEQAQEVHAFIRGLLAKLFDRKTADEIRILYGGSVTPDNIKILMSQADIDGGLVGGASLKADSFAKLVKF
ncbi:MAG: triose-phosphate isomerase [Candidatus Margulisbacteria bacterium]|nr:triose-phosphate isomerase [Candidatus Margulisiibacteriota bacterium]MBU1616174.1 triose-phosphate isomerase [Candidatus Margulisiibacteriota bacterium]